MKNKLDSLFYHKFISELAICYRAEYITLMAEEKSPLRKFLCLFAAKLPGNEDLYGKKEE